MTLGTKHQSYSTCIAFGGLWYPWVLSVLQRQIPKLKRFSRWAHAGIFAPMSAIAAMLLVKSHPKISKLVTAVLAINESRALRDFCKKQGQRVIPANLFVFTYSERDPRISHLSCIFRDGDVSVRFLSGIWFPQTVVKTLTQQSSSTNLVPCSINAIPISF